MCPEPDGHVPDPAVRHQQRGRRLGPHPASTADQTQRGPRNVPGIYFYLEIQFLIELFRVVVYLRNINEGERKENKSELYCPKYLIPSVSGTIHCIHLINGISNIDIKSFILKLLSEFHIKRDITLIHFKSLQEVRP